MSVDGATLPLVARRARSLADVSANPVQAVFCRVAIAHTVAAVLGAIDIFALLQWVLPLPARVDDLSINLVALAVYLPLSIVVGTWLGKRGARDAVQWLAEGRPATDAEKRRVLREPLRCALIDAAMWAGAAALFFVINLPSSVALAGYVAETILMGGATVCALNYLLCERLIRPVTALALADGPPQRTVGPGVKGRLVLAWLFATGVPLVALIWVAADVLAQRTEVGADQVAVTMLALSGAALVVGLVATILVAKSVSEPLTAVRKALRRVEAGDLDAKVRVIDGSEVGLLQSGFNRMAAGLQERDRLQDLFGRHVGEEVAREALERGEKLGGEIREAAVLFIDLVGSTAMAAKCPPDEVVGVLNRFFAVVVEVVGRHGGWVNKFEGDAALVIFGCPADHEDCAGAALAAARELPTKLALAVPGVQVGIGVSAGQVVAGNVGAEQRFEYTVVGDPVNEAARLCELAKTRPDRVLASEAVLRRAGARDGRWRLDEKVTLRGRSTPTRLVVPR
ncbi:MAG TPA: adenylate/guanylate cyclase domain-containing protein [Solirubrobacteraceae bacterium]|jgi:adenylate cyclase